jgi:hypothetical protein
MPSPLSEGPGRAALRIALLVAFLGLALPARGQSAVRVLLQAAPLAGSQFHALPELAGRMTVGDALTLRREPDNRHDPYAVRVEWQGRMLGYVPRRENRAVAAALDQGVPLEARISRLRPSADPWQRLEFEVLLGL